LTLAQGYRCVCVGLDGIPVCVSVMCCWCAVCGYLWVGVDVGVGVGVDVDVGVGVGMWVWVWVCGGGGGVLRMCILCMTVCMNFPANNTVYTYLHRMYVDLYGLGQPYSGYIAECMGAVYCVPP